MPLFTTLTRRALLPLLLLVSTAPPADNLRLNITGRILSSACQPEINPLTVPLGNISRAALSAKGSTAPAIAFQLRLKNCPAEIGQIKVQFDGTPASGDNSALALTAGSGVATGVAVQLQDAAGAIVPPGQASALMTIKGGSGSLNSLGFTARYIATADSVTAGSANASATFTIWYSN
ncbi:fimbrial protein [Serratia liquefaciens]|uniref:fimbrial protein n=1 Tax=Serratia liquefaciens TaxID=614 RepID=UPI0021798758|nr:fimbrial protein [Serratia liquefaciens]CAI0914271.1 fimbrial protein BcfF [Serratia liquefaciens]